MMRVYDCIIDEMLAGYAKSGNPSAVAYKDWPRFSKISYTSDTHGGRLVNNYANDVAKSEYSKFEDGGTMPVGSILAKDSFTVSAGGRVSPGPLFLMEKMSAGFDADGGDWRYTLMMPSGQVIGVTGGSGSGSVAFCKDCHIAVGDDQDFQFFLPEELRTAGN